jgi:hypothetical protein
MFSDVDDFDFRVWRGAKRFWRCSAKGFRVVTNTLGARKQETLREELGALSKRGKDE